MRTIKFRGLRVDNNEMVFGFIYLGDSGEPYIIEYDTCVGNEIEVIPETVGQFTGRTDLKGVDIFEGDRVSDPHGNPGECELFTVEYNDEMARFDLNGEGEAEWDETDWQVYDNIHEQKPTIQLSEQ